MEDRAFPLPEQKNYEQAYKLAYEIARGKLSDMTDVEEQCKKSESQYQLVAGKPIAVLRYLNHPYQISIPDGELVDVESDEVLPAREKLVILHYFISAKGTPSTGKLVTFRELPDGVVYQPTFSKRTVKPIMDAFGKEPDNLLLAGQMLGGYIAALGDASVTINAFPRVPLTFVVWQGDDEFPSQGNVLFDSNIVDYLPTEDVTVLCEIIAWRLVRLAGTLRNSP